MEHRNNYNHNNNNQINYHDVLKVHINSTPEEIKKAYRKLSMKHHPDRGGDTNTFRSICEAYEVLSSNPCSNISASTTDQNTLDHVNSLPDYNNLVGKTILSEMKKEPLFNILFSTLGKPNAKKIEIGDIFNMLHTLPQSTGENTMNNGLFGFSPFNNIFGNIKTPKTSGGDIMIAPRPEPIIYELHISMREAYMGTTKPIEINRMIIENNQKREELEKIYIKINEGIDNNEIIRLVEKGHRIDQIYGDLEINIKIKHNHCFERNGLDLICHKKLSFKESLVGFGFKIKHPNGKEYEINNIDGDIIMNKHRIIQERWGFKRGGDWGNMIIVFEVESPKLSTEQKEKLKQVFL